MIDGQRNAKNKAASSKSAEDKLQLKVRVGINSAKGLGNANASIFSRPNPYAICEVPGKPDMRFSTKVMVKSTNPRWNHDGVIRSFEKDDTLQFSVMDNQVLKKDKLLGTVTLTFEEVVKKSSLGEQTYELDNGTVNLEVLAKGSMSLKDLLAEFSRDDKDATEELAEKTLEVPVPQDRAELKAACFKMLGNSSSQFLSAYEVHHLLQRHFDFEGNFDNWNKEYLRLCKTYQITPAKGISEDVFSEILDDRTSVLYCGNGDLKMLYSELQLAQNGSTEPLERTRLLDEIFDLVDIANNKRLSLEEMRRFARAVGFPGSDDDWAHEFNYLCGERGWDSKVGICRRDFKQLVNDEDGGVYCNDEQLTAIKTVLESQAQARQARIAEIAGYQGFAEGQSIDRQKLFDFFFITDKLKDISVTNSFSLTNEWEKEYLAICRKYGRSAQDGITLKDWTDLLNQKSSWSYFKDRNLGLLAKEFKRKLNPEPEDRGACEKKLFNLCDADGDESLNEGELRRFAVTMGWKGSRQDWFQEYRKVCKRCTKKADEGLDLKAFITLVNDEDYQHGVYYCSDEMLQTTITKFQNHDQNSASAASGGAANLRRENATGLFNMYDFDGDSRLTEAELRAFARHVGFRGDEAEWTEEYRLLCLEHGWNMQAGLSVDAFTELIDSKQSGVYRTNEEIQELLDHFKEGKSGGQPARRSSQRWPAAEAPAEAWSATASAPGEQFGRSSTADFAAWYAGSDKTTTSPARGNTTSRSDRSVRSKTPPGRGAAGDDLASTAPAAGEALERKRSIAPGRKTRDKAAAAADASARSAFGTTRRTKPGSAKGKRITFGSPDAQELSMPEKQRSSGRRLSEGSEADALKQRAHALVELFRACDKNDEGRLKESEIYSFAVSLGFRGQPADWGREYRSLCSQYGWDAEEGLDKKAFVELVDTKGSAYYCNDRRLQALRSEVLYQSAMFVKEGSILMCVRNQAVKISASMSDSKVIGTILPGSYVTAAGPAQMIDKVVMVPVRPEGVVQWAFFKKAPIQMTRDKLCPAVFVACDANQSGFLKEGEMYRFAQCMGFPGAAAEWSKEYASLCKYMDVDPSVGLSEHEFVAMVGHEQSPYYCSDIRLASILEMLPSAEAFRGMSERKRMLLKRNIRRSLRGQDVAAEVFRTLDVDYEGRVTEEELQRFIACLQGHSDGVRDWHQHSRVQEILAGHDTRHGLDIRIFCQLVSDRLSPYYCENEQLASIGATVAWDVRTARKREAAAMKIQSRQRGKMARKQCKEIKATKIEEEEHAQAAVKIQSIHRGSLLRKEMGEQQQAAVRIQASYRGSAVRERQSQLKADFQSKRTLRFADSVRNSVLNGLELPEALASIEQLLGETTDPYAMETMGPSLSVLSGVGGGARHATQLMDAQNQPITASTALSAMVDLSDAGNAAKQSLGITIESARGLRSADWRGKSDPYCICGIQGKSTPKIKTPVMKQTLDPVWNFNGNLDYSLGDSIEFCIWDKDMPPKSDDFLGRAILKSSQFSVGFSGEIEVTEAGKGVNAFLKVSIDMPEGPGEKRQALENKIRELKATTGPSGRMTSIAKKELEPLIAAAAAEEAEQQHHRALLEQMRRDKEEDLKRKAEAEAAKQRRIAEKQRKMAIKKSWIEPSKSRYKEAVENGELVLRPDKADDARFLTVTMSAVDLSDKKALRSAVKAGDEMAALAIIEHSEMGLRFFETNKPDCRDCTVFHAAAESGMVRVVKALLGRPNVFREASKPDYLGWSALHRAARFNQAKVVQVLLEHSNFTADMRNAKGKEGWSALHLSAFHGHQAIVKLLLDHPNFTQNDLQDEGGRTALHLAAAKGWTPLCHLIAGHPGFTKTLAKDCQGLTAAETAAEYAAKEREKRLRNRDSLSKGNRQTDAPRGGRLLWAKRTIKIIRDGPAEM